MLMVIMMMMLILEKLDGQDIIIKVEGSQWMKVGRNRLSRHSIEAAFVYLCTFDYVDDDESEQACKFSIQTYTKNLLKIGL